MSFTVFASNNSVFINCECVQGFAFTNAALGDNCALSPVICAGFGLLRDNCALFRRVERLSPHSFPV